MATDIFSRVSSNQPLTSNVMQFPTRRTLEATPPARKGRKPKQNNVLPFTGVKRRNYDSEAELPRWKETMLSHLQKLHQQVYDGEITGLAIISAEGVPTDDEDPGGSADLLGVYYADPAFAARMCEWLQGEARECAEKWPARAISGAVEGGVR